jgi:hypothetical protein
MQIPVNERRHSHNISAMRSSAVSSLELVAIEGFSDFAGEFWIVFAIVSPVQKHEFSALALQFARLSRTLRHVVVLVVHALNLPRNPAASNEQTHNNG